MTTITQTRTDLATLQESDPKAYRDQLVAVLGASLILTNQAEYPKDYDSTLTEADEAYVPADWVEIQDTATLNRLGFSSRAAVEARIRDLDSQ